MQRGICRLCQLEKDLQDSHFVGKAVYKRLREPSLRNPNPVTITTEEARQSSIQVRDYVFCADCEQIFNRRGESFIHTQIATTAGFPLLDLFAGHKPAFAELNYKVFEGTKIPGLDAEALLHYGAGIFFKAATHRWDFEGTPYGIDLGKHTEPLRRFVKDGVRLPADTVIGLAISSRPPKFLGCFPPVQMNDTECVKYKFYVSGILYTLMLGDTIPSASQRGSFSVTPTRVLFMMDDVSDQGRDIMRQLAANARLSPGLQQLLEEQRRNPPHT